ncbi:hypothetical protein MHU86_25249 [Fragilaria crotonensis]|nr:hypothetical protein MHU86_25249 [Fragilaria crotonensis]
MMTDSLLIAADNSGRRDPKSLSLLVEGISGVLLASTSWDPSGIEFVRLLESKVSSTTFRSPRTAKAPGTGHPASGGSFVTPWLGCNKSESTGVVGVRTGARSRCGMEKITLTSSSLGRLSHH